MRHPPFLAAVAALAALAGCASEAPPTASAPQTLAAVEAYRACAWGHMKPLLASSGGDSVRVAIMAEAACGQQREAIRDAVLFENAASPRADAFAETYADEARRMVLQSLADAALQKR